MSADGKGKAGTGTKLTGYSLSQGGVTWLLAQVDCLVGCRNEE